MKNKVLVTLLVALTIIPMMFCFVACDLKSGQPKEYVIQYTDDAGLHEITVKHDQLFSIEVIPQKEGYTFDGLFDAEVGGTQYVSAKGTSLAAFTDKKNMVLYPQFKPIEYTVILDYQGAQVTGSRQLTVAYDSSFPELPKNLLLEHKNFVGWYTKPNCEGVQIADQYGLIPLVSVLNGENFDITATAIYLYAGFDVEKINVTCCFENGETEVVQVDYDTPVSKIVPKKRVEGKAPITWSKSQNGEIFNGTITSETVLYAVEYAPVIELDSNGGSKVTPIVAREGSTVALPTPTKDMAKFAYWEDMQGNKYTSTTMPSSSISLKAVWQAKIVFDENGGTDVDDISTSAGTSITLPSTTKAGYIFAGWYTEDKQQYTSTTMPSNGIKLKAGWYKEKQALIVVYTRDNERKYSTPSLKMDNDLTIDFSQYISANFVGNIKIEAKIMLKNAYATLSEPGSFTLALYNADILSDSYKVFDTKFKIVSQEYAEYSYSTQVQMRGNKLYGAAYYCSYSGSWDRAMACDYRVTLTYPDTANLYL